MNTAADLALAIAIASYKVEEHAAPITVISETSQKLVKVQRKSAKPAAKIEHEVQVTPRFAEPIGCPNLPKKGTYDAKGYMLAMRNAKDRDGKLAAIAGWIGYDPKANYAEQELAANFAAKRELRPIVTGGTTLAEERAAKRSALGFVKGMPDAHQVKVDDLLAREKLATNVMLEQQKLCDIATANGDEKQATHHAALALLEQERLDHIQREVLAFIGDRPTPNFAKIRSLHIAEDGTSATEETPKPIPNKWDGFFKR